MAFFTRPPRTALPLPNTYWVVPDRLLAGEHPYGMNETEARERLQRLRAAGIDSFVDLTEEHEMPDYRTLLPPGTNYLRSAILDTWVPDDALQMHALQLHIQGLLDGGGRLYVHCRAGIGRTGLVVGCFLAEGRRDGRTALKQLNRLWRQSARSETWPTVPQTREQADYIRQWPLHRKSALSQRVDS